jgi:hypothetical protein
MGFAVSMVTNDAAISRESGDFLISDEEIGGVVGYADTQAQVGRRRVAGRYGKVE